MLNQLVALSNRYGQNPELVLAGGGNTSLKDANTLYIKGSGTSLADIDADGFVKMDRALLAQMRTKEYPALEAEREAAVLADLMSARQKGEENKRPSVETLLHDLFEYRFVVHTHPALVNGLTCGQHGAEETARLFGSRAVWIPLVKPGYVLAMEVKREMDAFKMKTGRAADLILLQNHGIFVAGDTEEAVDSIYKEVLTALETCLTARPDFSPVAVDAVRVEALKAETEAVFGGNAVFVSNEEISKLTAGPDAFYPVSSVFTPDHIVYCKHTPLFVSFAEDLEEQRAILRREMEAFAGRHGFLPQVIAVEKLGVVTAGKSEKTARAAADLFLDGVKIAVYSRSFGGPLFLSREMIAFISNWEVEAYRQKQTV